MGRQVKHLVSNVETKEKRVIEEENSDEEDARLDEENKKDNEAFVLAMQRRKEALSRIKNANAMAQLSIEDVQEAFGISLNEDLENQEG